MYMELYMVWHDIVELGPYSDLIQIACKESIMKILGSIYNSLLFLKFILVGPQSHLIA